jgi:hypothetical protein
MGISALVDYGLVTAQAGLTYDERIGFLLGLEFAGQEKIDPDKLAARAKVIRADIYAALSQKLINLNQQPTPTPTPGKTTQAKPLVGRKALEDELAELQKKAAKAQSQMETNPHAVDNIIRYGERMKAIKKQLERT